VDRPADHEITATDPYGGGCLFGAARNTVLMVSTAATCPRTTTRRPPGDGHWMSAAGGAVVVRGLFSAALAHQCPSAGLRIQHPPGLGKVVGWGVAVR